MAQEQKTNCCQHPRKQPGQKKGNGQPCHIELQIPPDRSQRTLAEEKAVSRRIVHQQFNLLVDGIGVLIEIVNLTRIRFNARKLVSRRLK